jgi:sulfonate transport system substrate-binding protein
MSVKAITRRGFVASAAALSACAPHGQGGGVKLRIGHQKSGVLLLAKLRGQLPALLAPAGISSVDFFEFGAGPPLLEALRAGAIDIGGVGDTPPIFAQAAGAPLVYAAAEPLTGAAEGLVVPASSPVQSLRDLKGKRIAFTKGSSAHLFTVRALATVGLSLDDVTPAYLSPADAAAAFSNGALDAWAIWDPFFAIVQASQKARLVVDGRAVTPSNTFYIAAKAFADASPKALAATLTALAGEAAWANAHQPDAAALIQGATGMPGPIVTTVLGRGDFSVKPVSDAIVHAQQGNADLLARLKLIPSTVDVSAAVWRGWTPAS